MRRRCSATRSTGSRSSGSRARAERAARSGVRARLCRRTRPLGTDKGDRMDVETAIRAFASAGHDLPRDAMRWALDNWDEAAPGLLEVVERFAGGADRSE